MRVDFFSVFPTVVVCITLACSMSKPSDEESASAQPESASQADVPKGEHPKDRDQVDDDGVVRRGEALSEAEPMTVPAVLERAKTLDGKSVKVTGTVGRVCRKSGCWFELKGEGETRANTEAATPGIRITSKGYRFFVPSQAAGMTATLEGHLKVQLLDVETAQHYADDAAEGTDKPAPRVTAPVPEVSIAAVALEMTKAKQDG